MRTEPLPAYPIFFKPGHPSQRRAYRRYRSSDRGGARAQRHPLRRCRIWLPRILRRRIRGLQSLRGWAAVPVGDHVCDEPRGVPQPLPVIPCAVCLTSVARQIEHDDLEL